jgi:hypothetical protein
MTILFEAHLRSTTPILTDSDTAFADEDGQAIAEASIDIITTVAHNLIDADLTEEADLESIFDDFCESPHGRRT